MPAFIAETTGRIVAQIRKSVVGQEAVVDQVLACVLAGGHVLLEGVPGIAKTLLARVLAHACGGAFRRIQFTPDLMPSDVIGTEIYVSARGEFELKRGPIFTDFLLADEVNRTPPKTQSALLECMQERTASIGGASHALSRVFTVLATQNPVEYEGTYPLPEAQVDRFMLKVLMSYPSADEELDVLRRYEQGVDPYDFAISGVETVAAPATVEDCRQRLRGVRVDAPILKYVSEVVRVSRAMPALTLGASPRAAIALLQVSRALAAMRGKDYLSPDEVKEMAPAALRHRLMLTPEAQVEGLSPDRVVDDILAQVQVPR